MLPPDEIFYTAVLHTMKSTTYSVVSEAHAQRINPLALQTQAKMITGSALGAGQTPPHMKAAQRPFPLLHSLSTLQLAGDELLYSEEISAFYDTYVGPKKSSTVYETHKNHIN